MAYQSWSVVFGEQPSAAKWNILGTNDASFNDGSGFGDEIVLSKHLAPTMIIETCTTLVTLNSATFQDITGCTTTFTPDIASVAVVIAVASFSNASVVNDTYVIGLDVDGVNQTGEVVYAVPTSAGRFTLAQLWIVGLTAASHTLKLEGRRSGGSGSARVDADHTKMLVLVTGDANITNS